MSPKAGMLFALMHLAALLTASGQADAQAAGLQALDHHDFRQAQQIFSKEVADHPKNYAALFNLALAESELQNYDAAAADYKQVLVLRPALYEAELNLSILLLRQKHPADAVPLLQDAAKQKPDQAKPESYLGQALLETKDYAGAREAFQKAVGLDPKFATAELGLGQALSAEGKLDDALPHYQRAVALDSRLKSYLLQLADTYCKQGRAEQAIGLLKQFPEDAGAREELGTVYLQSNRPADAVKEFEAAVAISPTSANQLALATAYLRNNQEDLAKPILERALAEHPNDYELRMVVGRLYRDKHEYPTAAGQFIAAAQLKPDSVEAWNEAASALVIAERYPEALAALDKVRALKAENAGDYYYRAIVLDKLHQLKPALASYQQFLSLSAGKYPDQEFVARQRSRILEREVNR